MAARLDHGKDRWEFLTTTELADYALRTYMTAADQVAEQRPADAAATVRDYLGSDDETASVRLWGITFIGPGLIAGAARRLVERNGATLGPDDLWVLDAVDGSDINDAPPHVRVAAQTAVRALNGDDETALEMLDAHYNAVAAERGHVDAHEALWEVLGEHLAILATLIERGAFATDDGGSSA